MAYKRSDFKWEKIEIYSYISSYDYEYFSGDLDAVIAKLQQLKLDCSGVYHRINFSVNYDYENTDITVYGYAWETDDAFTKRIHIQEERIKDSKFLEKQKKKLKEDKDYQKYLELKAKFEDNK